MDGWASLRGSSCPELLDLFFYGALGSVSRSNQVGAPLGGAHALPGKDL